MMPFEFRVMREDDLEQVLQTEHLSHLIPWTRINFQDCIQSNYWNYVLVQKGSSQILGHCVVMPGFEEVHLLNITVHPQFRRQKIAISALNALEKTSLDRNIYKILLEVRQGNLAAITLYQQMGYQTIGSRKDYYPKSMLDKIALREDAVVMEKNLSQSDEPDSNITRNGHY